MSRVLFLPCRRGSERVPEKNTRPFAGHPGGLLGVKLDQLERLDAVDVVLVDSNDPRVLERATARRATWAGRAALEVRERPDHLGCSDTTTDQLIAYALDVAGAADELAWTHVTSPLCDADTYARGLAAFDARDRERHDSLMAVHPIRSFVWSDSGPLNYRREPIRWPRTQDLAPVHDVCSALFVVPITLGRALGDRIGHAPLLFPLAAVQAIDVDWEDDFRLAELLFAARARGEID